ncbi:hypothetical protein QZH41_019253 [Actinostola sp. cb2023]|nr:hypothetical protein QZH41_019253 [Actinostola sp. cb2023]
MYVLLSSVLLSVCLLSVCLLSLTFKSMLIGDTYLEKLSVPATINCRLREYQREGIWFLYQHYHGNSGAILGDDMGLGKTVQVIAFFAAVLGKTGTKADVFGKYMKDTTNQKKNTCISQTEGCFLVVSPGSVLYNWQDELDTWGYFKVRLYHGSSKEGVLEHALKGKLDIVLTTYETLRLNLVRVFSLFSMDKFNKVDWLAVIMDEAHRLKDPKAQLTIAAKALKVKRRYGLTGTPLQNRFSELWCVLDWANPGCLGSVKRFMKEYSKPIKKGQRFNVTKRELAVGRTMSKQLQSQLSQWFLRRTKDLISHELPHKGELDELDGKREGEGNGRHFWKWTFFRGVEHSLEDRILEKFHDKVQTAFYCRYS